MKYVVTRRGFSTVNFVYTNQVIDTETFQHIALEFAHGAVLNGVTYKHAKQRWIYSFVDAMPKAYLYRNMTTPQKAYDFGKQLIEACNKANRLSFEELQKVYKTIYRILTAHDCRTFEYNELGELVDYLPNPTIYPEVRAEDDCNAFIKDMRMINSEYSTDMPEELLRFYCRAFQINAPTWWIAAKPIAKTYTRKDGSKATMYAICPEISSTYNASYSSDYAGNLDENGDKPATAPYTLLKDARPQQLSYEDRATIIASVEYFLSLPIEEQKNFLADNFEYTENGELVEISHEEREERELAMIKEAIRLNTARLYAGISG